MFWDVPYAFKGLQIFIYWGNALSGLRAGSTACINPNRLVRRHGPCLDGLSKGDTVLSVHPLGAWAEHAVVPACSLGMEVLPLETRAEVRWGCEMVPS